MDHTLGSNSNLQNQLNALRKVTMMKSTHCPPPPPPSPATLAKTPRKSRKVVKKGDNQDAGQAPKSSLFRGVTKHRYTGRYEVHLWDKFSWNLSQKKRGKQVYVGSYNNEEEAAYTYDLAALKYFGPHCILNFPLHMYIKEYEEMKNVPKNEYIARLRRKSSGFARGESKYRGVTKHYKKGRWEARIGNVCGRKYLYLGSFNSQDEAATAYDLAALYYRGPNAVTNFDISKYTSPNLRLQQMQPAPELHEPAITENLINSDNLSYSDIFDTMPMNTMMGIAYDESLNCDMYQNGMSGNMCMMDTGFDASAMMLQNVGMGLEISSHLNIAANQGSSNMFQHFGSGVEYVDMDSVFDAAPSNQSGNIFNSSGMVPLGDKKFHGIDEICADFGGTASVGDQASGAADFAGITGNEEFFFPTFYFQ